MFTYVAPVMICGSCGHSLICVDKQPYNAAKQNGVVQVMCRHRECSDYDKPMEFDLPQIELRPTTDKRILDVAGRGATDHVRLVLPCMQGEG